MVYNYLFSLLVYAYVLMKKILQIPTQTQENQFNNKKKAIILHSGKRELHSGKLPVHRNYGTAAA